MLLRRCRSALPVGTRALASRVDGSRLFGPWPYDELAAFHKLKIHPPVEQPWTDKYISTAGGNHKTPIVDTLWEKRQRRILAGQEEANTSEAIDVAPIQNKTVQSSAHTMLYNFLADKRLQDTYNTQTPRHESSLLRVGKFLEDFDGGWPRLPLVACWR